MPCRLSPLAIRQPAAGRRERLNRLIVETNACGGELGWLAAPAAGAAIPARLMGGSSSERYWDGRPSDIEPLTGHVLAQLARCVRTTQQGGKPVTDPVKARQIVADVVQTTSDRRTQAFRQLVYSTTDAVA